MMLLKDDFYKVIEKTSAENKINAVIELNPAHGIFKGHFPQQPIVPGVCQMHVLKEMMEEHTGKKLRMGNDDNIKFTGMIIPDQNLLVNIELTFQYKDDMIAAEAKLFAGETVFTKYKGKFKIV
jgi:3-hydroxyacyl-[acyl-carrier-protein] dehydratase